MPKRPQTAVFPKPGANSAAAPLVGALRSLGELRLLRHLGSGGMSDVFLAFHPPSRRTVAVKILADHLAGDQSFVKRFAQEAHLSRKLEHPNLVRGLACGRDAATRREFMVMEFVDGPTAQEMLDRRGPLTVADAVRITIDIARALEYLHQQGYVHRDIKPGNILLKPDGTAKLADLGVAKALAGTADLTSSDHGIGTPYYMPWEQTVNAGIVDARSDLFALGATLYHLVTGRVPFPGETDRHITRLKEGDFYRPVRELDSELPPELDAILAKLLVRDPRRRFANATELIDVLNASGLARHTLIRAEELDDPQAIQAPTRVDVQTGEAVDTPITPAPLWLLRFRDADNMMRYHRGTTLEVIRWYHENMLPEDVEAARNEQTRYRPLTAYREFQSLRTVHKDRLAPSRRRSRRKTPVSAGEWFTILNLSIMCLTGLLSIVLSVCFVVWALQQG